MNRIPQHKACGIIDFKELHLKEDDVFLVQPGQVHRFVSSQDVEGWLMMADSKFVGSEEKCAFDYFSLSASSFTIDERRKEELRQIAMLLEHRLNDGKGQNADAVVSRLAEAFIAVIAEAAQEQNTQQMVLSARQVETVLAFQLQSSQPLAKAQEQDKHRDPHAFALACNNRNRHQTSCCWTS